MSDEDFVSLVEEMRRLQREYFRRRDKALVPRCKALEKEVDNAIAAYRGKLPAQGTLVWE